MIDKFATCKDCPDRSIQPNCHTTCEGYLARCKKREEIRKAKAEYYSAVRFDEDVTKRVKTTYKKKHPRKGR